MITNTICMCYVMYAYRSSSSAMEYRYLGNSGLRVSVLSYGAWVTFGNQMSEDEAYECMLAAYQAGCNFFDNAEVYAEGRAETMMGKVLARMFKEGVKRSDVVITTKIYWGSPYYHSKQMKANLLGLSRKHIVEGTKGSLERFGLDYVDVIYAHRPDANVPMEEIVRAFNWVIEKGYALYWGTSEWSADQLRQAYEVASKLHLIGPITEQSQYNMLHRSKVEVEYAGLQRDYKLGNTIWSPLASGILTGKYSKDFKGQAGTRLADTGANSSYKWLGDNLRKGEVSLEVNSVDKIFEIVDALKPIAERLGASLAQLALAWTIYNKNVSTAITGASKASQVVENFQAIDIYRKLTPEIYAEIEKILDNAPKQPVNYAAI